MRIGRSTGLPPAVSAPATEQLALAEIVRAAVLDALAMSERVADRDRLLLPIKDAATALGCGRTMVYELIGAGRLKTVAIGRRKLIARKDIEAFVESIRAETPT